MTGSRKQSFPLEENRPLNQEQQKRLDSAKPSQKLEIVTWQVNSIKHLLKPASTAPTGARTPLREIIEVHDFPAIICLQDIRVHRSDEAMKQEIVEAANMKTSNTVSYEVYFSLRGAQHLDYELREAHEYEYTDGNHQPSKDISGGWAGICTLVRADVDSFVQADTTTGQPDWDVPGRFHILVLDAPRYKLVVINCFFTESAPLGGRHDLAFTGARLSTLKELREEEGKVPDWYLECFLTPDHKDFLSMTDTNWDHLKHNGYPKEVLNEMGNSEITGQSEWDYRKYQHRKILHEALAYQEAGFHVVLVGSMNISPYEWKYTTPAKRPPGYKRQEEHQEERRDFNDKFLDESKPENGFCGWDAWKLMNVKFPNSHFAIVSPEIKENDAILDCKVLDHVKEGASFHDSRNLAVSKNIILDTQRLGVIENQAQQYYGLHPPSMSTSQHHASDYQIDYHDLMQSLEEV